MSRTNLDTMWRPHNTHAIAKTPHQIAITPLSDAHVRTVAIDNHNKPLLPTEVLLAPEGIIYGWQPVKRWALADNCSGGRAINNYRNNVFLRAPRDLQVSHEPVPGKRTCGS